MLFFDGRNHPSAATVIADGLDGGLLYAGTPTSSKDFTAVQYADYKAHGLHVGFVFEHVANDFLGGVAAGKANAAALVADCRAKRANLTDPCCVTVDEHVASASLPTVIAYVTAFRDAVRAAGWRGPVGVYGFSEVTTACHGDVDWFWGAGSRSAQPPWINVWQDNTGTIIVGGAADDKDWVLIPIPPEESMTSPIDKLSATDVAIILQAAKNWLVGNQIPGGNRAGSLSTVLFALKGEISAEQAAIIAAIGARPAGQPLDVQAVAAALAPMLKAGQGDDLVDALRAEIDKQPAR